MNNRSKWETQGIINNRNWIDKILLVDSCSENLKKGCDPKKKQVDVTDDDIIDEVS